CLAEAAFAGSLGCLTSPPSGGYRFYGLPHESYKVVFSAEASEIEDPEPIADAYPTQWWNGAPTFATATSIPITPPATVSGVDGSLGPAAVVPAPVAPVAPPPVVPKKRAKKQVTPKTGPKVGRCRKGTVRRKVHGKARCVRRHKAARHRSRKKKS